MSKAELLLTNNQIIFTIEDLSLLWEIEDRSKLVEVIKYYIKTKRLFSIKRGVYSKKKEFSNLELAQKLIPFSYITFHTALSIHGINYQYYTDTYSSSTVSKTLNVKERKYIYKKLSKDIFFNKKGLIQEDNYLICSPERAICESLYFYPRIGFDNLNTITKDKLIDIGELFNNQRLKKRIIKLIKTHSIK